MPAIPLPASALAPGAVMVEAVPEIHSATCGWYPVYPVTAIGTLVGTLGIVAPAEASHFTWDKTKGIVVDWLREVLEKSGRGLTIDGRTNDREDTWNATVNVLNRNPTAGAIMRPAYQVIGQPAA